jgi:hypothetical protein
MAGGSETNVTGWVVALAAVVGFVVYMGYLVEKPGAGAPTSGRTPTATSNAGTTQREGWVNDPTLTGYVYATEKGGMSIGDKPTPRGADQVHVMYAARYLFATNRRYPAHFIDMPLYEYELLKNPGFQVQCQGEPLNPPMRYTLYDVLRALDDKGDPSCGVFFSRSYSEPAYDSPSELKGKLWFDKNGDLRVEVLKLYKRDTWLQ